MAATTTVQTIIDNVFNELGIVSTNSISSLSTDNLIRYVNSAHKELLNHPDCTWEFMMKTQAFNIRADATVANVISEGDLSITLSSTSTWPSTGRVVIEGEEFDYTANVANVLTIPAAQADHPAGAEAMLCYAVPTDFQKVEELWIKQTSSATGRGIRYNYLDFRMTDTLHFGLQRSQSFRTNRVDISGALPTFANNFFIHEDFIYFPYHTDERYAFMKYSKKSTKLSALLGAGGILDVPDEEERLMDFILETILARCYKVLKRYDRVKEHKALAMQIQREIVAEHKEKTNKIHTKQIKTYW